MITVFVKHFWTILDDCKNRSNIHFYYTLHIFHRKLARRNLQSRNQLANFSNHQPIYKRNPDTFSDWFLDCKQLQTILEKFPPLLNIFEHFCTILNHCVQTEATFIFAIHCTSSIINWCGEICKAWTNLLISVIISQFTNRHTVL